MIANLESEEDDWMAQRRPYPYSDTFEELCGRFVDEPLPVSFRGLVGPLPADANGSRIHPYPARLLRQVPVFILGCEQLICSEQAVYDPFCGSGTVPVEANAHGFRAWGTDSNPFAVLLARVKVTPVDRKQVEMAADKIVRSASARAVRTLAPDAFLDRWFSPSSRFGLDVIREAIERHHVDEERDVLLISLSLAAERIAHKDPRIPVPVRVDGPPPDIPVSTIRRHFLRALDFVLDRLPQSSLNASSRIFQSQAAHCLALIESGKAPRPHLILTSPPYGAAQKYIRSSSISLAVLGIASGSDFAILSSQLAGREWLRESERESPLPMGLAAVAGVTELIEKIESANAMRGAIYRQYFIDMWNSFLAGTRALSEGGHYVLVSSSNTVAGLQVATHEVLATMLQELGLRRILSLEDRIAGRALMTRRATTASLPIQSEVVHIFRAH